MKLITIGACAAMIVDSLPLGAFFCVFGGILFLSGALIVMTAKEDNHGGARSTHPKKWKAPLIGPGGRS